MNNTTPTTSPSWAELAGEHPAQPYYDLEPHGTPVVRRIGGQVTLYFPNGARRDVTLDDAARAAERELMRLKRAPRREPWTAAQARIRRQQLEQARLRFFTHARRCLNDQGVAVTEDKNLTVIHARFAA